MVLCGICEAPYHRDCWDYQARCSIYGCGSRAYKERQNHGSVSGPVAPIEIPVPDLPKRLLVSGTLATGLLMTLSAIMAIIASHTGNLALFDLMLKLVVPLSLALGAFCTVASESVLVFDRQERRATLKLRLLGLGLLEMPAFQLGERPELAIDSDGPRQFVARLEPGKGAEYLNYRGGPIRPPPIALTSRFAPDSEQGARCVARIHRLADEIGCPLRIPDDERFGDTLRLLAPAERQARLIEARTDKKPDKTDPEGQ